VQPRFQQAWKKRSYCLTPHGLINPVLDECEIAYWMNHIAQGLKYLRSKNIVHRDLKPRNFMLQKMNQSSNSIAYNNYILKLADLGFGKLLGNEELTGTYLGTDTYWCPEILDKSMYTANVDLWSVGVILFEMITARKASLGVVPKPTTGKELLRNVAVNLRKLEAFDISQPCRNLVHALLQPSQQRITFEEFFNHPFIIAYVEALVGLICKLLLILCFCFFPVEVILHQ